MSKEKEKLSYQLEESHAELKNIEKVAQIQFNQMSVH